MALQRRESVTRARGFMTAGVRFALRIAVNYLLMKGIKR
jgi:hypothetical protein